jgi:hypothetical protein
MYCLHCGDCCKRMSPISNSEPCPHIITDGIYTFCGIYKDRPRECVNHKFQARFCPVGLYVLKLTDIIEIQIQRENGYRRMKELDII